MIGSQPARGSRASPMSAVSGSAQWRALQERWAALPPREKLLSAVAGGLVLAALVWWIAVRPALSTLRTAGAEHQQLDSQLQRMRALQAQAKALQSQPRQNTEDAARALEASVTQILGSGARMVTAGERVTVTLSGVRPDALAQWLAQARINAHAVPGEAHLNRNANGLWDGTVVLSLPPR